MKNLLLIALLLATVFASIAAVAQTSSSGLAVSGRVTRSTAVPAKAVERVIITELNGTTLFETALNPDGSFRFTKVRPGTYRVQVQATNSDWMSESAAIQVFDRDVTGVSLAVYAIVTAKWALAVEGDGLRPPVTISLTQYRGGQGYRLISLSDGVTEREIVEGEYRVSWTALPAGYFIKSIATGSTDILSNPLKIDATKPPPQITVTLGVQSPPPWVKVSGRVASVSPGPLPTTLRLMLEDTATQRRTPEISLKEDGSFELPMVLPGTYRPVTLGTPSIQVLGPTSIVVPSVDMTGLQIAVSARKEVSGKVTVEGTGGSSPPTLLLIVSNRVQTTVSVQPDGSFKTMLAVGTGPFGLAVPGHAVRSVTYGATNLLQQPLTVGITDTAELRVTVVPNPPIDKDDVDVIITTPVPLTPLVPSVR